MDQLPHHGAIPVGGHPMAGAPQGGHGGGRPDLFTGATWAICPIAGRGGTDTAVATVRGIVELVGARPVLAGAAEHDRAAARASHLPYACGVAALRAAVGDPRADLERTLAGNGLARVTRAARADADTTAMWSSILASNADEVAGAIDAMIKELVVLRDRVAVGGTSLHQHLAETARLGRFLTAREIRAVSNASRTGNQS
jgi:prephenate dehydrogenase